MTYSFPVEFGLIFDTGCLCWNGRFTNQDSREEDIERTSMSLMSASQIMQLFNVVEIQG